MSSGPVDFESSSSVIKSYTSSSVTNILEGKEVDQVLSAEDLVQGHPKFVEALMEIIISCGLTDDFIPFNFFRGACWSGGRYW